MKDVQFGIPKSGNSSEILTWCRLRRPFKWKLLRSCLLVLSRERSQEI